MNANERGIAAHKLLSDIRNARYETVWVHVQRLLDQPEIWQNFTTGNGSTYEFRSHEFDWFLAELTPDLDTLIRDAMVKAPPDLELRYADVCGRGEQPTEDQRRPHDVLAGDYPDAAKRLRAARPTDRRAVRFRTPEARSAHLAGKQISRERLARQQDFRVRVSRGDELAPAIVAKLLGEPDLAHQVYEGLRAANMRTYRQVKRTSEP